MSKNYRNIVMLGCSLTGRSVMHFCEKHSIGFVGVDRNTSTSYVQYADTDDVPLSGVDALILSPGIAITHPLCQKALQMGVVVIGEAEFAMQFNTKQAIGITGTNGKSTVVAMIHHILQEANISSCVCGNHDLPLIAALDSDADVLIVELSSFQLETMQTPGLLGGCVLNISPDHLDRYENVEAYAKAKLRLQSLGPLWVTREIEEEFGHLLRSYLLMDDVYTVNVQAAMTMSALFGVSSEHSLQALQNFKGVQYRLEPLGSVEGIFCYNDSKSTNTQSVIFAVQSLQEPVILIGGGRTKEQSLIPWSNIEAQAKRVVLFGESKEAIGAYLDQPILCHSLQEATEVAFSIAQEGDAICFSPGCASFDLFKNYKERGRAFSALVERRKEHE